MKRDRLVRQARDERTSKRNLTQTDCVAQVDSVKGRSSWSGPHNWAYLDMMMTGGQGCKSQCVGSKDDTGICNFTTPQHCPGQTDAEYRTEASLYAVGE